MKLTEPLDTSPTASEAPAAPPEATPAEALEPTPPGDGPARRGLSLRLRRRGAAVDGGQGGAQQETGVIERLPDPDQPTGVIPMDEVASGGGARLRRERKALMGRREEMLFHLGGLTFELYRAGRLGEAVARHRAGMVAEVDDAVRAIDEQLAEIDRRRARRRAGLAAAAPAEAGACLVCRAPFYAEARFCMQCGARFAPPPPELLVPSAGDTQVIPAEPATEES